jgi:two-component system NtrC family sensor kinase
VQFVGDSVDFLAEAMTDSLAMITAYRELRVAAEGTSLADQADRLALLEEELDIEFVEQEAPRSIERTKEGVRRVAEIIAAMRQFSHPGGGVMEPTNLDEVIEMTLVVARNEYKYVAEIEWDFGPAAAVIADRGDISQVILNLIVNAAHAIADHVGDGAQGKILIRTRNVNRGVEVAITDTGGGVPAEIRDRIFDPFFTTKEPGRGTGQGRALAHSTVVERHGGRLDLEVDAGVGSTFRIFLPAA